MGKYIRERVNINFYQVVKSVTNDYNYNRPAVIILGIYWGITGR